ncbi:unnamed protein product [Allacma fusca]|uniref:Uncharacterized protein n=1 Tax=Allacma fusca TaxID=39272 RepID=A0A8J2P444_9HEXA|nr:unnamed protein product [Allacma fusca]
MSPFLIIVVAICVLKNSVAVRIDVDTSQARDLENLGKQIKSTLERWYPYLSDQLYSSTYEDVQVIPLYFDPSYEGVAYAKGRRIVGAVDYYRKNSKDIGSMIHEMVHVIQQYRGAPVWLGEGIADYYRYYHYEDRRLTKPTKDNKHTDGYGTTAFFLNWVDQNKQKIGGRSMIYWLNKDAREGKYTDNIWPKLLGQTVQQVWQEMMQKA